MRCDLHVHTIHSGMCTVPLLSRICRESYNDPDFFLSEEVSCETPGGTRFHMGVYGITSSCSGGALISSR